MSEPTKVAAAAPAAPEYDPHPLSVIFPRMGGTELTALAEDIKANGLREPIWLLDGKILDGNNRYRACQKAYHRFKDSDFRQFDPKVQGEPLAFVVSVNLTGRRHLNESQRAAIAATLVSSKLGSNQYNRAGVTDETAAKLLGVSLATVKMAKTVVKEAAPEVLERVQKGEVRLAAAQQVIKKPKDQQAAELRRIEADRKAAAEAAKAARAANAPKKEAAANQKMTALDDFKKKWLVFDDMQRRAFVTMFEADLANLLDQVRQQNAMIGGATANVG